MTFLAERVELSRSALDSSPPIEGHPDLLALKSNPVPDIAEVPVPTSLESLVVIEDDSLNEWHINQGRTAEALSRLSPIERGRVLAELSLAQEMLADAEAIETAFARLDPRRATRLLDELESVLSEESPARPILATSEPRATAVKELPKSPTQGRHHIEEVEDGLAASALIEREQVLLANPVRVANVLPDTKGAQEAAAERQRRFEAFRAEQIALAAIEERRYVRWERLKFATKVVAGVLAVAATAGIVHAGLKHSSSTPQERAAARAAAIATANQEWATRQQLDRQLAETFGPILVEPKYLRVNKSHITHITFSTNPAEQGKPHDPGDTGGTFQVPVPDRIQLDPGEGIWSAADVTYYKHGQLYHPTDDVLAKVTREIKRKYKITDANHLPVGTVFLLTLSQRAALFAQSTPVQS